MTNRNTSTLCSNANSPFGIGCYRSGDVFYTYCTPYANLIARCDRCCDCGCGSGRNTNNSNNCSNTSNSSGNNTSNISNPNVCKRRHPLVGGDYGNCYFGNIN